MNGKLLTAAKAGNLPEVQKLIGSPGINVNHTEWNGDTALSYASNFGHVEVLHLLISAGATVNSFNKKGESALMQASSKGYLNVVNILIEHGANINHQSKTGYSALMMATIGGHLHIIDILLTNGADISLHNTEGKTALEFAQTDAIRAQLQSHHASTTSRSTGTVGDKSVDDIPSTMGEGVDNINNSDSMNIIGEDDDASMSTETAAPSLPLPAFKPRPPPPRRPSLLSPPPAAPPAPTLASVVASVPASAEGIAVEKVPSASEEASVVVACPAATTPAPPAAPASVAIVADSSSVETTAPTSPTPPPPPPAVTSPSSATYAHSHSRRSTGHSKSSAVSSLLGELIQHCGSTALQSSHLPYTVLHARLRHLCATFESVRSSALVYKQECITEYYAIQLEPILTHAKSCISPNNQRKPLFSFSSHHCKSDHKLLALFLEVDCDLTKLLRELIDALIAVNLTDLTIAVQSLLSSIGPIQTYMLTATGTTSISNMEQVATPRESDDEDPRISLLEYTTNSGTTSSGGTTKNKDGILFMFNMHRPILHSPLRRRPSRRHFTATGSEEGYGEWPGLSNLSGLCSELTTRLTLSVPETLRSAFSIEKETKRTAIEPVEKLPEEWFQDTATAVPAIQQVTEAAAVETEERKWEKLPNLADPESSSQATSPVPPETGRVTPKRISNSVFARLGNFDPTKTLVPGARPVLPGAMSPLSSPVPNVMSPTAEGAERLHGGLVKADSIYSPMTAESAATTTTDSIQALASAQLERATTTRTRRAPAKKKFEAPVSELPVTLVVVPIVAPLSVQTPSSAAATSSSVKTPTRMGAALKSLFKSRKGSTTTTNTTTTTTTTSSTEAAGALVLQDTDTTASSPHTPAVGTPSSSSISTMLTSLFSGSGKVKSKAPTQSAVAEPSDFSRNLGMVSALASAGEDSQGQNPGSELLSGGLVVIQNIALSAEKLPVIGVAAVLMLQLIDLCDCYRCNQRLFSALKCRMQFMYGLYFAKGGIAEIAHKKGKHSVMAPFAKHLEILLLDAISYLTAFTKKGFFHKLMSGRKPQQRFMEIDADVTKCLNGLTTALQLLQVAEVSAAYEQLQLHTRQNECIYEAVADVQRKVDRCGGLQGVRSMGHIEMKRFAEELGVRDVKELCEELADCEQRLEGGVDRVSGEVWGVKSAVAGEDSDFKDLRELVEELQCGDDSNNSSSSPESTSNKSTVELSQWMLQEAPKIDRNQRIGTGAFGSVYCGTYLDQPVAVKLANVNTSLFSPDSFPELQREVRLHLRVCGCAGVVKILAVSLEATALSPEPCVVMERALGSLHDYLHKQKHRGLFLPVINLSLTTKLTLALQVASAMEYISAAGLIHRDIKSSNVLIFYDEVDEKSKDSDPDVCAKICDFGLSKTTALDASINMSSHVSVKGTPCYLSPEAFNAQYSTASDVYAYGVLLNEILTEEIPVPASTSAGQAAPTIFQLRDAVCRDAQRPALYDEETPVAQNLRALITQCWAQNPGDRYTFADITVELTDILRNALRIAKYGSRNLSLALDGNSEGVTPRTRILQASPLPVPEISPTAPVTPPPPPSIPRSAIPLPPPPPPRPHTTAAPPPPPSTAAIVVELGDSEPSNSTPEVTTIVVTTAENGDHSAGVDTTATPAMHRDLDSLTVEEVGALMDAINMHALKDVLVSHRVSGAMLACCESVEDLLSAEFGLQSRGLAGGLLRRIQDWQRNGIAL